MCRSTEARPCERAARSSVAYGARATGFTVGRSIGLAYLPADVETGAKLEVEVLGEPVGAVVAEDALVDPANDRILA